MADLHADTHTSIHQPGDAPEWTRDPFERAVAWLDRTGRMEELGIVGGSLCILIREHLRAVQPTSHADRSRWANWLQGCQDSATGSFDDSIRDARAHRPSAGNAFIDPVIRATTSIALQALQALATRPAHDLHGLDGLDPLEILTRESADSVNAALMAEDITSMWLCLLHRAEVEGSKDAYAVCHRILDRVEGLQDRRTGLFAVDKDSFPWKSIIASDWLIPLFAYVHRPVRHVARIVDSILSLEESDDALARTRGSAREALAVVRLLTLLSRQSTYRAADVRAMLLRTHTAIAGMQRPDGSFPDAHASAGDSRLFPATTPVNAAGTHDLLALSLRVLTMSAIEQTYAGATSRSDEWCFHSWPGLAYHSAWNVLTEHERSVLPRWVRPTAYDDSQHAVSASKPVLSVVVPCYNLGAYLHEAIESVLAQSDPGVEIVIVNDGSTEEFTRLALDHFDRPRTRIVHQENRGLAAARNEGIQHSRGQYVCCLDPDDRLRPGFLARACAILDADPAVGFVSGYFELFDEQEGAFCFESCEFPSLLVHNRAIEPAVFRREGWERAGGYCTTFSSSGIEDWDLWISLVELGYSAAIIPEIVWEYRIRADQMSTGMYQPDTWARLVQELVLRHPSPYREHMAAVMAGHAERWADLRRWADERGTAAGWWERQARNWERLAGLCNVMLREQQTKLEALQQAVKG